MYGAIYPTKKDNITYSYILSAKNNISPLSEEFTVEHLKDLIKSYNYKGSVKMLLATNQGIPGLGNGVLQDILFNAKVNPKTKISSLTDEMIKNIHTSIIETLKQMIEQGGRDTEKDFLGNFGKYHTIMSKNNELMECPNCHTHLTKEAYLGGSVYYCSNCQERI